MNIVRKLRGGMSNSSTTSNNTDIPENLPGSSHTQLGLMHLKKLFSEYTHPIHPLSDIERDDKLYNMLPLFCKVFGSSPTCDMNEKFWDILAFTRILPPSLVINGFGNKEEGFQSEYRSCELCDCKISGNRKL
ncbi:hypothetical protein QE152_g35888 [Popillia japonica]|uniref:Uncharacterized protein n=1 Tax=Popillia japonica TaxID=7064 RepID=A0AAW1IEK6_POPJA